MIADFPALTLTEDGIRQLLRECVTVVRPGETLVIRVPPSWSPNQVDAYQGHADAAYAHGAVPFRALVVVGEELGIAEAG